MSAPTTRRALFGASAAALALFGAAGEGKAAELDGRLLDLVAGLEAVQAKIEGNAWQTAHAVNPAVERRLDAELEALQVGQFWPLADEIAETPARTPEGIQAKARALRIVHGALREDDDPVSQHMLGLVRDLVGEA